MKSAPKKDFKTALDLLIWYARVDALQYMKVYEGALLCMKEYVDAMQVYYSVWRCIAVYEAVWRCSIWSLESIISQVWVCTLDPCLPTPDTQEKVAHAGESSQGVRRYPRGGFKIIMKNYFLNFILVLSSISSILLRIEEWKKILSHPLEC